VGSRNRRSKISQIRRKDSNRRGNNNRQIMRIIRIIKMIKINRMTNKIRMIIRRIIRTIS